MADIPAASASRADVLAAIALANPGDRVIVPSGTASWAGDVSITGITLMGPGADAGSPTVITAGTVNITKDPAEYTYLLGFRFESNSLHLNIEGEWTDKAFVVGDCYFENDGSQLAEITANGGLFYECTFEDVDGNTTGGVIQIELGGVGTAGEESWQSPITMGDLDTTGEANIYFEDCVFRGITEAAIDNDNGGRTVIRYCDVYDSCLAQHGGGNGTSGQDTSTYGGRHLEIYNNTFIRENDTISLNKWVWIRGSTGLFVDNTVDEASAPPNFPNKDNVRFSVGCPGNPGYPLAYQFGQSTQTPDATPNSPFLIYGNTGSALIDGLITISGTSGEGITCVAPNDYIQSGRDYETSNTWGWAPYIYPHPLRGAVSADLNVTNLNATTLTIG